MKISLLDPRAAKKAGAKYSANVAGTADYHGTIICEQPWSPIVFKGSRRLSEDFISCQVFAYDIDNGPDVEPLPLAETVAKFEASSWAYSITTTASHQKQKGSEPPKDRFRIVVFSTTPLTSPFDYVCNYRAIAEKLGIAASIDQNTKDLARYYAASTTIASECLVGDTFDIIELPAPSAKKLKASYSPITAESLNPKGRLSRATCAFLVDGASPGKWHQALFKAAIDMKEQGYTEEEAVAKFTKITGELDDHDTSTIADVYNKREGQLDHRIAWPVLQRDRPNPTALENANYLIQEILGYKLRYNTRNQDIYITKRDGAERSLEDIDIFEVTTEARRYGLSTADIMAILSSLATANSYDPLMHVVESLKWDGTERISQLFETLTLPEGVTATERAFYLQMLRRFLIGIVTKVYEPGHENNVLVFRGDQGIGKSRWLHRLSVLWPAGYGEGQIDPSNKDHELRHLDNFLWNVAELDATFNTRDVAALKEFFTKKTVQVRRPYGKRPVKGFSVCSFCASVNTIDFLRDGTGNRRYLVIPIVGMKSDHTIDMLQVYAEAKEYYMQGERNWYDAAEIARVNELNAQFLSEPDYIEELKERLEPGTDIVNVAAIFRIAFNDKYHTVTQAMRSNVVTLLSKLGIQRVLRGNTQQFYVNSARLSGRRVPLGGGSAAAAVVVDLKNKSLTTLNN